MGVLYMLQYSITSHSIHSFLVTSTLLKFPNKYGMLQPCPKKRLLSYVGCFIISKFETYHQNYIFDDAKYKEIKQMNKLTSLMDFTKEDLMKILQSKNSNHLLYVNERLMNSSLLCDDSLSIFLHSSLPIIQSMDFSSKESTFEVIDNFFFLFDTIVSNSQINQSLFIPFFKTLFHQLDTYHVLMDYLQVIPCSYSSLLWLSQSFLSKCDDSFLLIIVFILY